MFHNYKKQIIYRYAISNLSFERGSISIIWITFLPRHIMFRFVWIIDRRTDYNIYKNWRWLKFYLETTIRQSLPIFDEISPLFQCLASSPIFPYPSPFVGSPSSRAPNLALPPLLCRFPWNFEKIEEFFQKSAITNQLQLLTDRCWHAKMYK